MTTENALTLPEIQELLGEMSGGEREAVLKAAQNFTDKRKFIPNPGPQTEAYFSEADEVFFGGGAGSGKSALICALAVQEHTDSILFRREFGLLKGLLKEIKGIVGSYDGYNGQNKLWRVPNTDKEIEFGACQLEDDKENFQGRAHDLKAFDEITAFTESQYRYLIGWTRTTRKGQRSRVVCTGNPPMSAEGRWVIRYWAPWLAPRHPNPAKSGELRWFLVIGGEDVEVAGKLDHEYLDRNGEKLIAKSRTFIHAKLEDNPYLLATGYATVIESMPEPMRTMLREGRFDMSAADSSFQVIPSKWVDEAMARWKPNQVFEYSMTAMGLDPAGGGNDAEVIAYRYGNWFDNLVETKGPDTKNGSKTAANVIAHRRGGAAVVVDVGGGYAGAAITRFEDNGIRYHQFNGGGESTAKTKDKTLGFFNKRAEAWWRFREALDPEQEGGSLIALPPDPELRADLCAPTFDVGRRGIQLESKDEIRKRIGRSPGKGDAVVMCLSEGDIAVKKGLNKSNVLNLPTRANVGHANLKRRW